MYWHESAENDPPNRWLGAGADQEVVMKHSRKLSLSCAGAPRGSERNRSKPHSQGEIDESSSLCEN